MKFDTYINFFMIFIILNIVGIRCERNRNIKDNITKQLENAKINNFHSNLNVINSIHESENKTKERIIELAKNILKRKKQNEENLNNKKKQLENAKINNVHSNLNVINSIHESENKTKEKIIELAKNILKRKKQNEENLNNKDITLNENLKNSKQIQVNTGFLADLIKKLVHNEANNSKNNNNHNNQNNNQNNKFTSIPNSRYNSVLSTQNPNNIPGDNNANGNKNYNNSKKPKKKSKKKRNSKKDKQNPSQGYLVISGSTGTNIKNNNINNVNSHNWVSNSNNNYRKKESSNLSNRFVWAKRVIR